MQLEMFVQTNKHEEIPKLNTEDARYLFFVPKTKLIIKR
mgnify:CR=1 FL=1